MNCKNMGCINLLIKPPPNYWMLISTPHPHDLNNNWMTRLLRARQPVMRPIYGRYFRKPKYKIIIDESNYMTDEVINKFKEDNNGIK